METKRNFHLIGTFSENRAMTNSRDGCCVSGTSITHSFWSGRSPECGVCRRVSPFAQQLYSHLTPPFPSLSFSLCLFIFVFILLLGGSAGWHELIGAHRQPLTFKLPAVSMKPKAEKNWRKRDVSVQEKHQQWDKFQTWQGQWVYPHSAHTYCIHLEFSGNTWRIWQRSEPT